MECSPSYKVLYAKDSPIPEPYDFAFGHEALQFLERTTRTISDAGSNGVRGSHWPCPRTCGWRIVISPMIPRPADILRWAIRPNF